MLQAEKHVWTVAHSGAQAELTNLSAALERERQAHEDTRAAWRKAKEMAHKVCMWRADGWMDGVGWVLV